MITDKYVEFKPMVTSLDNFSLSKIVSTKKHNTLGNGFTQRFAIVSTYEIGIVFNFVYTSNI